MLQDFKNVPIVVVCRDRLTPLLELLHWLDKAGYRRVILVDNGSTYEPLVEFFGTTEAEVVRLDANVGHIAPWRPEVRARLDPDGPLVVTDCDVVPDESCPPDVVEHLAGLLLRYAGVVKAGLGLRIDDLPDSYPLKSEVQSWESQFWETEIAPGVFRAPVDTTFALCRSPLDGHLLEPAVRTGPPYVGRHLPWYAETSRPTDEERYYLEHAERALTHWVGGVADDNLRHLLDRRARQIATRKIVEASDHPLLASWVEEPGTEEEGAFTPGARPGWSTWNAVSPEVKFCEFAASVAELVRPAAVIETGIGRGFTTRRLAARLGPDQQLLAFEHDPELRGQLALLPFFASSNCALGATPSPTPDDFARADLTVLDSEFPDRLNEFDTWLAAARPGALVLVHDASSGHPPDSPPDSMRRRIEESGLTGAFLRNPRGGFLGVQSAEPALRRELGSEREQRMRLEDELVGIRSSRAYRLIGLRGRISRWLQSRLQQGREST